MSDDSMPGGIPITPAFKRPKHSPPPNIRALQQVVNRYAEYHGVAPNRVQRWIAFMALGGALSRFRMGDDAPVFLIKGGVSLELRLRLRARATKDFDTTFRGELVAAIEAIEKALAHPYEAFSFRAAGEPRVLTNMTQFEIKVEYRGRVWSSVIMEVSTYEGTQLPADDVAAMSLADFGLVGPETLPCMPLSKQIAPKLHAMTETPDSGRLNDRFRDLLDLWILRELVPPGPELRAVCEETFAIRAKQPWPPEIVVHTHWVEPFSVLANESGVLVEDANACASDVRKYVSAIAAA